MSIEDIRTVWSENFAFLQNGVQAATLRGDSGDYKLGQGLMGAAEKLRTTLGELSECDEELRDQMAADAQSLDKTLNFHQRVHVAPMVNGATHA